MDKVEKIHRILRGKDTIHIRKLTTDGAKRVLVTLDPAGRKVRLEQCIIDNNIDTTGNLAMVMTLAGQDDVVVTLDDYDATITNAEGGNLFAGGSLIISKPLVIYFTNSVAEDKTFTAEIEFSEMDVLTQPLAEVE